MNQLVEILSILSVLSVLILAIVLFHPNNKKQNIINNIQDLDILMNIIDNTIKRIFLEKYKLEYELKDMRMIYDFKKDLNELVYKVVMSFNKPFMKSLQYYYTETYIISYITKTIEMMLMDFIKEKKLKFK